ncbi:efflux RND transporter periplasmic adaptor subunit [Spirochaeta isovalerica]|uniref:Multidrug efflux pump subunit AcrA (Membrane-fusion protein) n=1 Tax=Spirochaeta isovalerica TaxID=150 RepID=A0A841RDI8_9SPIO|nr:efflux RND transporter periplasmic adaptor subunit [Spirochaeta isovalerica]MBB6481060.1 multidrug efflux pump subunit AcrA (membrane-fusion protein) [Spirochaeta isovalerica]
MSDTEKKKSKIPGLLITLAVLVLAIGTVYVLRERNKTAQAELASEATVETEQVFAVNTTPATEGRIMDYLYVNGDIVSGDVVDVYPDTAGKLTDIRVSTGDRVKKGDLLAYVDPSRPGMNFTNSPVYSPISGTVTSFPGNEGSTVAGQSPIATIGDLSNLQVRSYISERKISMIALGMPAKLTFEAYPGETFLARITEISPVVDPSSRSMEIKLSLNSRNTRIKSGMFTKVKITTSVKDNVVKIPTDCISERYDEKFVYVVSADEKAEKRIIVSGISVGDVTEILSGISPGEKVVIQGQSLLEDGVPVKVIKEIAPLTESAEKEG